MKENAEQEHQAKGYASLLTLDQAAEYCEAKTETLQSWTESGHAPHYYYDGRGPLYRKDEIKKWARENLLKQVVGMPIPRRLDVLCPVVALPGRNDPPIALRAAQTLCYIPVTANMPGIYFLCEKNDVVYVGQSIQVLGRIATHIREGIKVFDVDRIYFIPCPESSLDVLEKHYIDTLRPRYNGDTSGGLRLKQKETDETN